MYIKVLDDFKGNKDKIPTEETIFNLIQKVKDNNLPYTYIGFPLVSYLHKKPLNKVQEIIDNVEENEILTNPFFVCQHIKVHKLNFKKSFVFTPHARKNDNKEIGLPHYTYQNINQENIKPFKQRKLYMSFIGFFNTHPTRKKLNQFIKNKDCKIKDSKKWINNNMTSEYRKTMNNSKISLCPRGTGESTIRLWESFAFGCVPVIISDNLKMPLENIINWEEIAIFLPENDIENIYQYLPDDDHLEIMAKKGSEIYKKYFSNKNLHKTITEYLKKI